MNIELADRFYATKKEKKILQPGKNIHNNCSSEQKNISILICNVLASITKYHFKKRKQKSKNKKS